LKFEFYLLEFFVLPDENEEERKEEVEANGNKFN
jgi:hypothetical protein